MPCAGLAATDNIKDSKAEINALNVQIRKLEREIQSNRSVRSSLQKNADDAAEELHKVQQEWQVLNQKISLLEKQIKEETLARRALEARIDARRERVAEWLRRNYVNGEDSSLGRLLDGADADDLVRDSVYLEYISRSNMAVIEQQRDDLAKLDEIQAQISLRRESLKVAQLAAEKKQKKIATRRDYFRQQLKLTDSEITTKQGKLGSLQENQQALTQLVRGLERIAMARAAKQRAEQAAAAQAAAQSAPANNGDNPPSKEESIRGRTKEQAQISSSGKSLVSLRGRLAAPVIGDIIGRFGLARGTSATPWKGIFIRADNGREVRAVADGTVAYAGVMRGYGEMIILEHGDDYYSIYANNGQLMYGLHDSVKGGSVIATVGDHGYRPESGVYFEIRHKSEALDPLLWIKH